VLELPTADQLRIDRLGECQVPSPLLGRGTDLTPDGRYVLIPTTSAEMTPESMEYGFEAAGPRESIFFNPGSTTAGVVTCGGLCPGINDVVRSLTLTLWHRYGVRSIRGYRFGFEALGPAPAHSPLALEPASVHDIHTLGGTILGSSRGPQDPATMVDRLVADGIDILFAIGGDGTLRGAEAIAGEVARRGLAIAILGIPKTIDNDIEWLDRTFGFATAVNEATRSIVAAHTEAHGAWNGIGLVKLMGRHAGFIAAAATLANSQVNYCLVPEVPFDLVGENGLLSQLEQRLRDRHHAVIVVAEGAGQEHLHLGAPQRDRSGNTKLGDIGPFLKEQILDHMASRGLPATVKYIDPSYLIRSLPANAYDSALCLALAQHAVHAAMSGRTNMLVGTWHGRYTHVPLALVTGKTRSLDPRGVMWQRVLEATGQPAAMTGTASDR
jgi:6-phosphofructokinase 1